MISVMLRWSLAVAKVARSWFKDTLAQKHVGPEAQLLTILCAGHLDEIASQHGTLCQGSAVAETCLPEFDWGPVLHIFRIRILTYFSGSCCDVALIPTLGKP